MRVEWLEREIGNPPSRARSLAGILLGIRGIRRGVSAPTADDGRPPQRPLRASSVDPHEQTDGRRTRGILRKYIFTCRSIFLNEFTKPSTMFNPEYFIPVTVPCLFSNCSDETAILCFKLLYRSVPVNSFRSLFVHVVR